MKKFISIALVFATIFAFAGCSTKAKFADVEVKALEDVIKEEIKTQLIAEGMSEDKFVNGNMPGYLVTDIVNDEENPITKQFNKDLIEGGVVIQHMMNINSNLVIVIKAKDEKKAEDIASTLSKIKENQVGVWSKYLPDQYEKVKNNVTLVQGQYLLYSTFNDSEKLKEVFNKAIALTE